MAKNTYYKYIEMLFVQPLLKGKYIKRERVTRQAIIHKTLLRTKHIRQHEPL